MLFLRGLSIDKDRLIRKFDINNKCYFYVKTEKGIEYPISYDDLDRKSKKRLLLENKELATNNNLMVTEIEKAKATIRFRYLKKIGFPCESFEYLGTVNGTISDDMNYYLDSLLSEENTLIGIHRVGRIFDDNIMNDIFNNGLLITGHMGGSVVSNKLLSNNVSYYPDNKIIKKELMYANGYKSSKGSILIRIPDEALEKNEDILLFQDMEVRLNPKYIIGYVPLYDSHHIENIIFNEKYLKSLQTDNNKSR